MQLQNEKDTLRALCHTYVSLQLLKYMFHIVTRLRHTNTHAITDKG